MREVGIGGIDWAERGIAGSWLLRCRGDEGGVLLVAMACVAGWMGDGNRGREGWMDGAMALVTVVSTNE